MMSTNLFINLQKEDIKRRVWIIAVGLLGLLLIKPVFLQMSLDRMKAYQNPTYQEIITYLLSFFSSSNIDEMVVISLFALVLGISGYQYLFSKKKTDFYHALPIKREKLFTVFYLNGLLIYLVLYVVVLVICMIMITAQGFMTSAIMIQILKTFGVQFIYFLFFYHTTIFAAMLTGNLLVAMAGTGVLLLYIPVLSQTIEGYCQYSFKSYYASSYYTFPCVKTAWISAITSYARYCNLLNDIKVNNEKELFFILLSALGMSILLLAASIWLYKKRPSEAAERAMVFKKTEIVIRVLLVIPMAMLGGILFDTFRNEESEIWFWFWFGLIFTGVLAHCAIEVIYSFDFKAIFRHKLQLILCLAAASAVTICFDLDLFGYDSYMPSELQVESAAIGFSNIDGDTNGAYIDVINGEIVNDNFMTQKGYQLRHMKLTDIKTVQLLAEKGIQNQKDSINPNQENDTYVNYTIKYNRKDGKEIYRTYSCPLSQVLPQVETIYNSKAYKEGAYPLTAIANSNADIKRITIYNGWEDVVLRVSDDSIKNLLDTYLKELSELKISEIQKETPLLRIVPEITIEMNYTSELYGYYIYPSFKKTLAELEELGMEKSEFIIEKIQPEDVIDIIASGTKADENYRNENYKEITYNNDGTPEFSDKLKELCDNLYPSAFVYNNNVLKPYEENITFEVIYKDAKGAKNSRYMVVSKGKIPDFIDEDFDK